MEDSTKESSYQQFKKEKEKHDNASGCLMILLFLSAFFALSGLWVLLLITVPLIAFFIKKKEKGEEYIKMERYYKESPDDQKEELKNDVFRESK